MSKPKYKQLSIPAIEQSLEIKKWLSQFSDGQKTVAKTLLSRVKFISRDEYSLWLRVTLERLPSGNKYALYSVRKLDEGQECFWDKSGALSLRPATSQGSEDLVYSLISNLVRSDSKRFFDHPGIPDLKSNEIRNFVLIDDSIGSGDRISNFVNAMLRNSTFLSWWSFGWVKITIVSFARPRGSEKKIINIVRGSDHGIRKFRKSSKFEFISELVYEDGWLEQRWGNNYKQIVELCRSQNKVPRWARLGYGDVLSHLVFFHSVPNNTPGILWYTGQKWQGLLTGRVVPSWLLDLLDENALEKFSSSIQGSLSKDLLNLLSLVKRGVRRTSSIAIRLNVDHQYALKFIAQAIDLGLLTPKLRLTKVGLDRLNQSQKSINIQKWNFNLYIPSSWCVGRADIQPSGGRMQSSLSSTDSVGVSTSMDGNVGETFLERSDAKAAAPPFSVMPQLPSLSRERHDTDGPQGSKDR